MKRLKDYFSSNQVAIAQSVAMLIIGAVIAVLLNEMLITALRTETMALFVVFVCLALIAHTVFALVGNTDALRERVGIKVTYLDESRYGRKYLFEQATKTVETATKSISIVNSFMVESGNRNDDKVTIKVHEKYYKTLLERATKGNVTYKRIVQLGPKESIVNLMSDDEEYVKHFRDIIDTKPQNSEKIGLVSAPARRPTTFVLVDDKYLIWQANQVFQDENGTKMRMQGYFLFEDPQGQITQPFRAFFESFSMSEQHAVTVTEVEELERKAADNNSTSGEHLLADHRAREG